jgi:hypothetical protein
MIYNNTGKIRDYSSYLVWFKDVESLIKVYGESRGALRRSGEPMQVIRQIEKNSLQVFGDPALNLVKRVASNARVKFNIEEIL